MGQAKSRGTFEERLAKAVSRNEALKAKVVANPNLAKFERRYGMQRLATRLIMSGMLVASPPPTP